MINNIINSQKIFFETNQTKSLQFRIDMLKKLQKVITDNETQIIDALKKDLNKINNDAYKNEVKYVISELKNTIKNLKSWSKPKKIKSNFFLLNSKSYVSASPYGVVLIISHWKYPFQLAFEPLIGAIAAGNCVIITTSEHSPNTTKIIQQIVKECFSQEYVDVVPGTVGIMDSILDNKFDYIFFTGGPNIGKTVMKKASETLTPNTTLLNGKSPCIIDENVDLKIVAKRIIWSKFLNISETSISPDYILVHKNMKDELIKNLIENIEKTFGESNIKNFNFPKMITEVHFKRMFSLIKNEKVIYGGTFKKSSLQIEPTLIEIDANSTLMNEEIFGSILPIICFDKIGDVLKVIKNNPNPLVLYLFTSDSNFENYILQNVSFGGSCVNDTVFNVPTPYLDFGSNGEKIQQQFKSKYSFEIFSNKKNILKKMRNVEVNVKTV